MTRLTNTKVNQNFEVTQCRHDLSTLAYTNAKVKLLPERNEKSVAERKKLLQGKKHWEKEKVHHMTAMNNKNKVHLMTTTKTLEFSCYCDNFTLNE